MGTILLTGIPGSGKTDLVQTTCRRSREHFSRDVLSISLSDIVANTAYRFWHTPREDIYRLDLEYQRQLRHVSVLDAGLQMAKSDPGRHVIVDTPMSMYLREGIIPDIIFTPDQIATLHEARPLDYIVTLLEDPHIVARRLEGTTYPRQVQKLLHWMVMEIDATHSVFSQPDLHRNDERRLRHLVIPRAHSDENLVKLLNDPHPPIAYLAGPITHILPKPDDSYRKLREKKRARQAMVQFRHALQEYSVVVAPMELADTGVTDEEIRHTINRDLHWFVADADVVIAHFPGNYRSAGVTEELQATYRTGKPIILIHPSPSGEVFGVPPRFHFRDTDGFFAAIECAASSDDPQYAVLRRFWDEGQNTPRYGALRPYAVAIDVVDPKTGKHLLVKQGKDKPFPGKWILPGGKKDRRDEPDSVAARKELFEETGLLLIDDLSAYRLYKVDYAAPNLEGIAPRYVRIFQATVGQVQGKPNPNHATPRSEVEDARWFTREQILHLSEKKVVPATLRYFHDIGIR